MQAQREAMAPADGDAPSDAEAAPAQRYPRNFSFQSRHAKLSPGQQRTWERLWPRLGRDVMKPGGVEPTEPLDTAAWFGRSAPTVLEIGSGTGVSTVAMALAEPEIDVIAVEVYRRGLAQLLCTVEREEIGNIRMLRGDAYDVLEHLLAPASLTGVRVFFPDPWPKARHHKRRLLQPAAVELIAGLLVPGGVLHAATDHAGYAEQIAEVGDGQPLLRRVAPGDDLPISVVRPTTKYEGKAHDADRAITELIWEKR